MRILMISDHADPLAEIGSKEAGGQNIYVYYLAQKLGRLGVYVDVYTRWDRSTKKQVVKVNKHFRVIRVKAGPKKYMPRDNFINVVDEFADHVLDRIKRERIHYDFIHSNYWFSGIIGLKISQRKNIPQLHVYHSIGELRFNTLKQFIKQQEDYTFFQTRKQWEETIAKKVEYVISTSPVEKQLIRRLFRIRGSKIKMIPIGIDRTIFRPIDRAKARRILHFPPQAPVLLYVGRLEWRKGLGTLLYAHQRILKKHPSAQLYIVGGGKSTTTKKLDSDEINRLIGITKELKIQDNVHFLGARTQQVLYKYYNAADVTIVPSYYEPFGIIPLESMACGTPLVVSHTGGLQYTVQDGVTGYHAKPRNYRDFARKIERVLAKKHGHFADACVDRVTRHFDLEGIAREYYKFLKRIDRKEK